MTFSILQPRLPMNITADGPLGISQVSGFYGPGAWAAWIMALISSWHTVLWWPISKGNHDTLLHLLYTNWAAVDLFRQIASHDPLWGPMAAAVTVSYWGLLHVLLQMVCAVIQMGERPKRTFRLLLLGTVIPSTALFIFVQLIVAEVISPKTGLLNGVIPEGVDRDELHFVISTWYQWVSCGLAFGCIIVAHRHPDLKSPFDSVIKTTVFWSVRLISVALFILSLFCVLSLNVILSVLHVSWRGLSSCSEWKPCAPQSMTDWDQAFTLLCGLVLFPWDQAYTLLCALAKSLYDMGTKIVRIGREGREWFENRNNL